MHKVVREVVEKARRIGWKYQGVNGEGHPVLVHENGERQTLPATPSDYRGLTNAVLALERKAGRKLPRQKSGKVSKGPGEQTDFDVIEAHQANTRHHERWGEQIQNLWALRENEIVHLDEIAKHPVRNAMREGRKALARIRRWEDELRAFSQPVEAFDPLTLPLKD